MPNYLDHYRDKRVLVTGGAGAIGSNLCRALADLGARVIVLDDLSSGQRWAVPECPQVTFVQGSVLDEEALRRVFFAEPQMVYHLAALFANQNSIDHPETDLAVNGLGTLKVLQYSRLAHVERAVYASSGCSVYGSKAPLPLTEDFTSIDLDTPYQITKLLGELYCNFFKNYYDMRVVRARFFNSYGPGEVPGRYRNVIPNFTYWAMTGQPLPITGTGEETRDFTYVGDIVDGLLRAGYEDGAVGEAMNLASGQETRIIDLAHWINELTENPAGIRFTERRKWDTHSRRCASVAKAGSLMGYEPRTKFREGLENTVRWFRDNWECIQANARF
ncbi:MAG: SDR family NAD(P)-dependent oxidoreductase [Chloroflexi bacterium]|nr:SDR family NAD(P)-dependent oxidoreductase [Chloroflexota bacterium]